MRWFRGKGVSQQITKPPCFAWLIQNKCRSLSVGNVQRESAYKVAGISQSLQSCWHRPKAYKVADIGQKPTKLLISAKAYKVADIGQKPTKLLTSAKSLQSCWYRPKPTKLLISAKACNVADIGHRQSCWYQPKPIKLLISAKAYTVAVIGQSLQSCWYRPNCNIAETIQSLHSLYCWYYPIRSGLVVPTGRIKTCPSPKYDSPVHEFGIRHESEKRFFVSTSEPWP